MKIDAQSYRIVQQDLVALKGNQEIMYLTGNMEFHENNPVENRIKELHEEYYGGETHTITIIVGKGTNREKIYFISANKKTYLTCMIKDVNENNILYLDENCTELFYGKEEGQYLSFE